MSFDPKGEQTLGQDGSVPSELSHAGAVVDKSIEYMLGESQREGGRARSRPRPRVRTLLTRPRAAGAK